MQPLMTCTQAWNGRSRRAARSPLKCGAVVEEAGGRCRRPAPPPPRSSSGRRCRFCGPSAPSTKGKRAKKSACSACGRQPVTRTTRAGVLALEPRRGAQVTGEAVVGALAHRARVVDEHVGVVGLVRALQAFGLEQRADALGVVLVHLAAERAQVVAAGHDDLVAVARAARRCERPAAAPPLLGDVDGAALADDGHADLARVVELILDLAGDLVRQQRRSRRRRSRPA